MTCETCGFTWRPEDPRCPGRCPECESLYSTVQRCADCPVHQLEYVRSHSAAGRLFERVLELDFDARNYSVPWEQITAEERIGHRILLEERERYVRESSASAKPQQ